MVAVTVPRYVEKFESWDGAMSYQFPLGEYEWDSQQGLIVPNRPVISGDYGYDYLNLFPAPKAVAEETIRVLIPDTVQNVGSEIARARSTCYRIGLGKLYMTDYANQQRWAWARLSQMPNYKVSRGNETKVPLIFSFVRETDWQDTAAQSLVIAITGANPKSFTITNPGNLAVETAVWRWRSNSATGWNAGAFVYSTTNGFSYVTTRAAIGANDEIRFNGKTFAVEYSANDGATYVNDFANLYLPVTQWALMRLEPGVNNMLFQQAAGTPDLSLEVSYYPAYE